MSGVGVPRKRPPRPMNPFGKGPIRMFPESIALNYIQRGYPTLGDYKKEIAEFAHEVICNPDGFCSYDPFTIWLMNNWVMNGFDDTKINGCDDTKFDATSFNEIEFNMVRGS